LRPGVPTEDRGNERTALIFYNRRGEAIGFYDTYDYNPLPQGERGSFSEIFVRAVGFLGNLHGAQDFELTYGVYRRLDIQR